MNEWKTFKRNMKIMYHSGGKQYVVQFLQSLGGGVFLYVFCLLLSKTSEKGQFVLLDFYGYLIAIYCLAPIQIIILYFVRYYREVKPFIEETDKKLEAEERFESLLLAFNKKSNQ